MKDLVEQLDLNALQRSFNAFIILKANANGFVKVFHDAFYFLKCPPV